VLVPTWRTTKKQYKCTSLVFRALDLHQSHEQLLEKLRWTCLPQSTLWRRPRTRVVRVAWVALVVTGVLRRAAGQARHSTSRLLKNAWAIDSVSCRDAPSGIWALNHHDTQVALSSFFAFTTRNSFQAAPVLCLHLSSYIKSCIIRYYLVPSVSF